MESDMARVQNGRREQTSRRNSTAGERKKRERYYRQYDYMLLFMTVAIALFGILMIYSASSYTASTSRLRSVSFRVPAAERTDSWCGSDADHI